MTLILGSQKHLNNTLFVSKLSRQNLYYFRADTTAEYKYFLYKMRQAIARLKELET